MAEAQQATPEAPTPTIELGPSVDVYPDAIRPKPSEPAVEAQESGEPAASEPQSGDAGAQSESEGTRRQRGEDAYQRGVRETREAIERERREQDEREKAAREQREAQERIDKLFADLDSSDYGVQDAARQQLLKIRADNQQTGKLEQSIRSQIVQQMAADFGKLQGIEGIGDDGYKKLHGAKDAAELAKSAFELGKKARDEEIAGLQAELAAARGRAVGQAAAPEHANGHANGNGRLTWDAYRAMSAKEARKLTAAQIDAVTAEHFAEVAKG